MKTLVLGASPNPDRYAYKAVISLSAHGYDVVPVGIKKGSINGFEIINGFPILSDIDTVTLYLNAKNQQYWYDYIIGLHPRRIIFNPGAENTELEHLAKNNGIQTINACTLVMLSIGTFEKQEISDQEQKSKL